MQLTITVPFSAEAFASLEVELQRAMRFALARSAIRIERECQDLMPVRTGRLRHSFKTGVVGDSIEMTWGAPYAELVDLGVMAHQMVAPTKGGKKAYRFTIGGKEIFTKRVNHPGFTGRFYRLPVGQRAMNILNEEMALAMKRIRVSGS